MSSGSSSNVRTPEPPSGGSDDEAMDALERAGRGDRAALMTLYDRYGGVMLAVALRITGTVAEGEEVVQDAMVRAWVEAPHYDRTRGTPIAWLVTLTRNRAIDVVRARGRRASHENAAVNDIPVVESTTPERAVGDAQQAQAVRRAITSLSDDQRVVLDLAYYGGLSHAEIAERLGLPLGTVKTRIAQCIRRLRDELEGEGSTR